MRAALRLLRPAGGLAAILWLAAILSLAGAACALGAAPRASLPQVERQVMCVTCKIPLDEAQSPQAARERAFIGGLIAEGRSEAQIKQALVGQYGPAVLAMPPGHGFDATVYAVPIAVVAAFALLLVLLLPSWRRRARRRQEAEPARAARLEDADAARLDADMARFD